eukprot:8106862-Pyramimonas_sp.AAC.1
MAECNAIPAACALGFGPPAPPPEAAHRRSFLPRTTHACSRTKSMRTNTDSSSCSFWRIGVAV